MNEFGKPRKPKGVKATLADGTVHDLNLVYKGHNGELHVWAAFIPADVDLEGSVFEAEILPPRTGIELRQMQTVAEMETEVSE